MVDKNLFEPNQDNYYFDLGNDCITEDNKAMDIYATQININESDEEESQILFSKCEWTEELTKLMLELYSQYEPLLKEHKIKKKKTMWEKITTDIKSKGYKYTYI